MQSNSILLRIDSEGTEPLYRRIAAAVRRGLASDEIAVGDRLPTARALAEELGVNMHTVLRAYGELRDEGLIDLRRRRGAVVLAGADATSRLASATADAVAQAKRQGLSLPEFLERVRREWE